MLVSEGVEVEGAKSARGARVATAAAVDTLNQLKLSAEETTVEALRKPK